MKISTLGFTSARSTIYRMIGVEIVTLYMVRIIIFKIIKISTNNIEYFYLKRCLTTSDIFSGQYALDKTEEIEVNKSRPSINDSILIQCPSEYLVQITEVNYGHKVESDKDDFCYSPSGYTNHIGCNHNVSTLSL